MNHDKKKAKRLYLEMFQETAKDPGIQLPTYFVTRHIFHDRCRKMGIPVPENFVQACQWEESIGLPEYAHRIAAAYHREHGSDFTPMEKGAWKLHKQMQSA